MWIQLGFALLQWLGPILLDWFLKWLEGRLKAKAEHFENGGSVEAVLRFGANGDDKSRKVALLRAVRADLYVWNVAKKRAIDKCIAAVEAEQLPVGEKIG